MVSSKSAPAVEEIETIEVPASLSASLSASLAEVPEEDTGSEFTDEDEDEDDDDDDDDDEMEFDPISQLAQLLVTEEGQPVADIMVGIKDALDKHNKILFKISTLLESKFAA
jgi:hypothetical protein